MKRRFSYSGIRLSEVPLPEGASLVSDPDKMVVHCVSRLEAEEEVIAGEAIEPEVIGGKAEDDEEGS